MVLLALMATALCAPTYFARLDGVYVLDIIDEPGPVTLAHADPHRSPQSPYFTILASGPTILAQVQDLAEDSHGTTGLLTRLHRAGYEIRRVGCLGSRRWRPPRRRRSATE